MLTKYVLKDLVNGAYFKQPNYGGNNYIVSKEFLENITIGWQSESMGMVELKGKSDSMELFALKI